MIFGSKFAYSVQVLESYKTLKSWLSNIRYFGAKGKESTSPEKICLEVVPMFQ
jgi:hypothetical protein